MPCDTVTSQSVNLSNAVKSILADALTADGWTIKTDSRTQIVAEKNWNTLTWNKGAGLTVDAMRKNDIIQEVTQSYSKRAVFWAASRAGWTVKQTTNNTLTVTRR